MLLAALLAGVSCSGPTTSATHQNPDAQTFAQNAMADGPMLVKITGTPYDVDQQRVDDIVLREMTSAMTWTATPRLTTDPQAARTPSMFVAMTFGRGAVDGNALCQPGGGDPGGGPLDGGAVEVAASFCGAGTMISNTSGRLDQSTGPDDAKFAQLIGQVTRDLFPSEGWQPRPGFGIGVGVGSGGNVGFGTGIGIGF